MTDVERLLGQAEVYLRDVNKVPLRATDAVLVQGALDAVLEAIAALKANPPLAEVEGWIYEDDWPKIEKASGQVLDDAHWCPIPLYGRVERGQAVTVTIRKRELEAV